MNDQQQPPRARGRVFIVLVVALGGLLGLGAFTFGYGEGGAYLSDDPAACVNCHVMQSSYDSWVKSSHRAVATCNDCHLSPHPVGKWVTKADNGFFHSLAFTTNRFPDPIRIKPRNARVTQAACLDCHADLLQPVMATAPHLGAPSCVSCHAQVGHAAR